MNYPFAALVGQESLKTALLLNALYPGIGGVLVRGEKGTAKSTAARALAELLPPLRVVAGCPYRCDPDAVWPDCPQCGAVGERTVVESAVPFVNLPIGATEDRVLGTLDFEKALREGRRCFQPGLLAAAHRGVLYIDEVNLLPDHLVDVLLDAAALGVNTVQREGMSLTHPARFLLIGTMNPEEGDLRPQLLDRFGLMVEVAGPRETEVRSEVVRRRLAFEADPAAFATRWAGAQAALRERLVAARTRLPQVVLAEGILQAISRICSEFEVDGLRADIVLHKTARALAAWEGRTTVTLADVRAAAEWVLPHRRRRRPFEQPGLDRDRLDDLLAGMNPPESMQAADADAPRESPVREDGASDDNGTPEGGARSQVFAPTAPRPVRHMEVEASPGAATRGKRNHAAAQTQGHYVRAVPDAAPAALAVDATVRAAARRGVRTEEGRLEIAAGDLHRKERAGRTGTLILFVVDASGSMAARRRMEAVKGAVLDLLRDAYEQRDDVGVLAFRGTQAEVVLPATRSVEQAERALRVLPTGGRTPLAHALVLTLETVRRARRAHAELPVLLVILSDGKANVGLPNCPVDPWQQALRAATELADSGVPSLVLDTDAGFIRMGRTRELAQALAAECLPLADLSANSLVMKVRAKAISHG